MIDEARTKGIKVHFASLVDICYLKNADLEASHPVSHYRPRTSNPGPHLLTVAKFGFQLLQLVRLRFALAWHRWENCFLQGTRTHCSIQNPVHVFLSRSIICGVTPIHAISFDFSLSCSVFLLAIHSHFILPHLVSCHHSTKDTKTFPIPPIRVFSTFHPAFSADESLLRLVHFCCTSPSQFILRLLCPVPVLPSPSNNFRHPVTFLACMSPHHFIRWLGQPHRIMNSFL